ncbi:MAG: alanine racemase [FCB group bacterium]
MRGTYAEVDLGKLKYNISVLRKYINHKEVLAIVKANGYGHGIVEISKAFRRENVKFLGVAFPEEGIAIRQSGDTEPIVVLVPSLPEEAEDICRYDLQPLASSMDVMEVLSGEAVKQNKNIKVHLMIGTGMNREGVQPWDAVEFMKNVSRLPNLEMIGVCTHFATSTSDYKFVKRQLDLFNDTLEKLNSAGYTFQYTHASNSGAVINFPESHFNLVRPGLMLYGYPPNKSLYENLYLKPVLTLKSKVAFTRSIKKGESVSYERLFIADKPTNIVTIPIGYGDGYFKSLTGRAQCLIKGKRYDIVGAICMDELMADIGDDDINIGDEVVLIGEQGNEIISAYEIAERAGTIIWEVLTSISARVPRIFIE